MDLPTLLGNAHAAQIWRSALARQKGVFFAGTVAALEQNKASAVVHAGQAERVAEMLWKQCSDVLGPEQLLHGMPSAAIVDAGDGSVASWVDVSVDKVRWLPPRQPHKTDTSSVVVEYLCVALDKRRRGLGIVQLAEALYQTMRYRPGIRRVNLNTVTGLLFRNMEFYLKAGFRYDLTDLLVTMAGEGPGERIAFAVINQTGQSAVVPAMLTGRIYRDKAKDIAPVVAKIVQQRPSLGAWFDVEHRGFLKAELVDAIRENRVGWMRVDDADLRWIMCAPHTPPYTGASVCSDTPSAWCMSRSCGSRHGATTRSPPTQIGTRSWTRPSSWRTFTSYGFYRRQPRTPIRARLPTGPYTSTSTAGTARCS